jgi:CRISPR-associated protein Csx3
MINRFESSDVRSQYRGQVIAVGGPPHSGKSVFLNTLHQRLHQRMGDRVFLEPVCPDGEGKWVAEAEPEVVQRIRKKYEFSPEFLHQKIQAIENLGRNKPLVLLDLGGKRSVENAQILARSTSLMILSSDSDEVAHWRDFGESQGCQVVVELVSKLVKTAVGELDTSARSQVRLETLPGTGTLVNLNRSSGQDCYQDAIEALSIWLMEVVSHCDAASE